MSRHLLFVLLLATSVALADNKPGAEHDAGAAGAQAKTKAAQGQPQDAQGKAGEAQGKTKEGQAKTKAAQGQPQDAQGKTGEAQGKTKEAQAKTKAEQGQPQDAQGKTGEAQGKTEEAQAETKEGAKLTSVPGGTSLGMSILGNQEAPKSLVIVPWKSSELGRSPGISTMLDDSKQPVDKEVFVRALRYYEIRSEKKP